ncbi:MAG: hypothetical protein Q4G54_05920 [Pelistega sp.]|nr:hypothetical protein [Pelistega sp.]
MTRPTGQGNQQFVNPSKINNIRFSCGALQGDFESLLPFFFVAWPGAMYQNFRLRMSKKEKGLFTLGEKHENSNSFTPYLGFLLPIEACRDIRIKQIFREIPSIINSASLALSDRRVKVQEKLDKAFNQEVKLVSHEMLNNFFQLEPSVAIFQYLNQCFEYITELQIDNGYIEIISLERFPWDNYGELIEWKYRLPMPTDVGMRRLENLSVYFVCGNVFKAVDLFSIARADDRELGRPTEIPLKWFKLDPNIKPADFKIRFEAIDCYGWIDLHITFEDCELIVNLSEVYNPFYSLLTFGQEVAEGDLPIQITIDEESWETVLSVFNTGNSTLIFIRAAKKYTGEIFIEGVVDRKLFASALRAELIRFFNDEFDPALWDSYEPDEDDPNPISITKE